MTRSYVLSMLSLIFALLAIVIAIFSPSSYAWTAIVMVALAGACLGGTVASLRNNDTSQK